MRFIAFIIAFVLFKAASAQFILNNGISLSNSADLFIVNGDWDNQGTFLHNGSIHTDSLFTNTGVLDPLSTGGFVLNYANTKTLVLGGKQLGFLSLTGGGTIELLQDINLRDSLVLGGGFVKMINPDDTLSLGPTGVIRTPGPTAYVKGIMRLTGSGDKLFPIGNDLHYLPITFRLVQGASPEVTVTLENFPATYTPGAAVDSLINFPFAWRTFVPAAADTASFVEIDYPDVLPKGPEVVVVRNTSGQEVFEGMGARKVTESGGRVKVTSYSKGLHGLFSIAKGFPGNLIIDSLALVAVFNSTGGTGWTNNTNWLTGPVGTWFGVTQTGASITSLILPSNNIQGSMPIELIDLNALQTINLADNQITALPEVSQISAINTLDVSGNNLDFGSLEANASILTTDFSNQAILGSFTETLVDVGTDFTVSASGGGSADVFQWKRNNVPVTGGATGDFQITGINRSTMGDYVAEITNPNVPGLMLTTAVQRVLATATLSGRLLIASGIPANAGTMSLFRITSLGGFDTTAIKAINNDGTYTIEKVVLDDYILLGFADTLLHKDALPTYFINTAFWEEADTLKVEDNFPSLDIISQFKPTDVLAGQGEISGFFFEDIPDNPGGRTLRNARIKRAGASLRRSAKTGKPQEDDLTLIAYVFTNDEGEFVFSNLEPGEYLLNIQTPGIPMDTTSFVNIIVGSDLFGRSVGVEAEKTAEKIIVRQLIITGLEEKDTPLLAYPNPTHDVLFVKRKSGGSELLAPTLYDLNGRMFDTKEQFLPEDDAWQLDVSRLPVGQYIVETREGIKRFSFKIIVRH